MRDPARKYLTLLLLCSFHVSALFAQDCLTNLKNAEIAWNAGQFSDVSEYIEPCLESAEWTENDQLGAYRLMALVNIQEVNLEEADSWIRQILDIDRTYRATIATDPALFSERIDALRPPPCLKRWNCGGLGLGIASALGIGAILIFQPDDPKPLPLPPGSPPSLPSGN